MGDEIDISMIKRKTKYTKTIAQKQKIWAITKMLFFFCIPQFSLKMVKVKITEIK